MNRWTVCRPPSGPRIAKLPPRHEALCCAARHEPGWWKAAQQAELSYRTYIRFFSRAYCWCKSAHQS